MDWLAFLETAGPWVGAVMSFFGGRKENKQNREYQEALLQSQYEYGLKVHSYNEAEAWDDWAFQMDQVEVARMNEQNAINHSNQKLANDWINAENNRLFNYSNEISAYNASVSAFTDQLEVNDIVNQLAISDNDRQHKENLIELGFKNENLINEIFTQQEGLAKQQKRSNEELGLKYAEGVEGVQYAQISGEETNALKLVALDQKAEAVRRSALTAESRISLLSGQDSDEARMQLQSLAQNLTQKQYEKAFESQKATVSSLTAEGQIAAGGQTGKSAAKRMQAQLASLGTMQAALTATMLNTENQYNLDKNKVVQLLENKKALSTLSYEELSNQLLDQTLDLSSEADNIELINKHLFAEGELKIDQLDRSTELRSLQIDEDYELGLGQTKRKLDTGQAELEEATISAENAYESSTAKIQIDKYKADVAAQDALAPKPTLPPQAPRPLAIPKTEFQNPREPVTPPLPQKGVAPPQPNPLRQAIRDGLTIHSALNSG